MSEEKSVPKLRFTGFNEKWDEKNLGDILTRRKKLQKISKDAPLLAFAAGQGVIDRSERKTNNRDFLTKDSENKNYLLTEYDDIVYTPSNLKYGAIDRNTHGRGVISPIYVTFVSNVSPLFMEYIVKSYNFQQKALKYEEGTVIKRQSVHPKNLVKIKIKIPKTEQERVKIGTFLSLIDKKMILLRKKYDSYVNFKKYLMQQIFAQKLRFNFTDEWKSKRFDDIFNIYVAGDMKKEHFNEFKNDSFKYPLYANALENNGLLGYYDEFKYNPNSITVTARGNIGYATLRKSKFNAIGRLLILTPKYDLNMEFFTEYINSMVKFHIESTGVPQLTAPSLKINKIQFPTLEEQNHIALISSSFKNKIISLENQIKNIKEFKKGLLQQMFV